MVSELSPICWVSRSNANPVLVREIDEAIDYCPQCVKVVVKEYRDKFPDWSDEIFEDGGYEPLRFSDSPAICERCQVPLSCSIEVDGEMVYIETADDSYRWMS